MMLCRIKKWFLVGLGSVSVALGVVGIFVPILPTTPFLLVAAACYMRSSERFYAWLLHHPWFGDYIKNYREGNGIPLFTKITVITLLWLTIGFSVLMVIPVMIGRLLLVGIAVGVTIHIVSIKTLKQEALPENNRMSEKE
jgi:uncharacterized protein